MNTKRKIKVALAPQMYLQDSELPDRVFDGECTYYVFTGGHLGIINKEVNNDPFIIFANSQWISVEYIELSDEH